MPRGHVKEPGSLPRPPIWNSCRRFCRYCVLGDIPAAPGIPATAAAAAVGEVGEPTPFFESSSELSRSVWRNGRPRLSRRAAAEADALDPDVAEEEEAEDGEDREDDPSPEVEEDELGESLPSLVVRLPYLFFR